MKKISLILSAFTLILGNATIEDIENLYLDNKILEAESLLNLIEDKTESFYYLAFQVYYKLDDLNNANKNLQKALEIDNDKYFDEGEKLGDLINDLKNVNKTLTSGFASEAIDESEKLVLKYKNSSICYYRLGYAYKENKDYDNAIINFNKAKELNPFNPLYTDEITYISNIEMLKGKELFDIKDYQGALQHFDKAIEYDPENASAMFRIGNIYYVIKDYVKAADIYERGLKISDKNYKVSNLIGKCYVALNEYDTALLFFDKALELNSSYTNALFEKAKVYQLLNDVDQSTSFLNEIILIDPKYSKAYELLMDIEVSNNNIDQAIAYGNSALIISPDAHTILQRMSSVYNQKELYDKGKFYAKSSLKSKKNYAPALFELGISELALCNKVAAKDAFTKCKRDRKYRRAATDYLKQENFDYYTSHCK